MTDQTVTDRRDDAPAVASKHGDPASEVSIPQAQGSTLSGWSVTINKPAAELFAFYRDFANLPRFMENIERIDVLDGRRSHWVVKGPAKTLYEWDARITEEQADRLIAWTSEEGADVANSGKIEFKDAGARGTVVTATLLYDPPGGVVGKVIAKMFQREPNIQVRRDLRRFKQLMEAGEVATPARNRREFEEMGL
ncbi:MAG: SRPBCC family protein [Alphaproteobacteria bacterium]|nr:MAG: SRPBCC family protein [Alphaproteobacteria bacterium]